MARQLTPLGKAVVTILKWVAIPLLVAFIGYSLGPLILPSGTKAKVKDEQKNPQSKQGKQFQSVRGTEH